MTAPVIGVGCTGFGQEAGGSLEELIFGATTMALGEAGLGIRDVDTVVLASSDLFDGRPISTMTLTGGTGTWGKSEIKICGDGIAAVIVAMSELAAGHAAVVLVSAWSKLGDTSIAQVERAGLEPIFARPLALEPSILAGLRSSRATSSASNAERNVSTVLDGAVTLVLGGSDRESPNAAIVDVAQATGSYLGPVQSSLDMVHTAVRRVLGSSRTKPETIRTVRCGGFADAQDEEILEAIGLGGAKLVRSATGDAEVGYAAGLLAISDAVRHGCGQTEMAIARTGFGGQNGYAAIVEGHR